MENKKRSFRIFSLEGGLAAFALYSLGSGLLRGEAMSIFWGIMTICGLVVLYLVRRRDWAKHWEEIEDEKKRGT